MAEPSRDDPANLRQPTSTDDARPDYFLDEVSIAPPLEEFRRVYAKKIRSFEGENNESQIEPYERAFRIGERMLIERLMIERLMIDQAGEGASC